jgi:OmpA family protein
MLKPQIAMMGAALLLGACDSQPQALTAPPQPAPSMAQSSSYLVFFDWDKSDLTPQAMATISQAASAYKVSGNARLTNVGNADTSGPQGYNMALSLRRADAVRQALIQNGVPAGSIDTAGRGETNLLVQTADNVREPQNRRVELAGLQVQARMDIFRDPRAYCQALMDKWRQYRNSQVDMVEAAAIAQCEAGNYQAGIPVLEDSLITARMPLPAPGYRWPGRSYSAS